MKEVAAKQRWAPGWAYDGRKSMYSPNMFLPQHETTYQVHLPIIA